MDFSTIFGSSVTAYVVIPLLIIIARILDVSIGTMRVVFISKGMRRLAPILGFFEVLIWLAATGQILANLTNWVNYIAYGLGFSLGNYIGLVIESKLALGKVILRIITKREADDLLEALNATKHGVTSIDAEGKFGDVKIMFMVLARKELGIVIDMVKKYNPNAFYSIEDIRYVNDPVLTGARDKRKLKQLFNMKWLNIRK